MHTHIIAKATSVTRNLLSTSQSAPILPTIAAAHPPSLCRPGRICSNSARKVNAHRKPHHAAGTVHSARHTNRGIYHFRSTPRITATRGCRAVLLLPSFRVADASVPLSKESSIIMHHGAAARYGTARTVRPSTQRSQYAVREC